MKGACIAELIDQKQKKYAIGEMEEKLPILSTEQESREFQSRKKVLLQIILEIQYSFMIMKEIDLRGRASEIRRIVFIRV